MLEARRVLVNHAITDHIHPFLQIFVNGTEVPIPANVGITDTGHYSPHTHDGTGKLHVGEGLLAGVAQENRYVTVGDFFDVWRLTNVGDPTRNNPNAFFDSTHLMDKVADANNGVFMTVNGVPNTEYQNYIPEDGDRIVVSYGPKSGAPILQPLSNITLLAGSPQYVSLDGLDPNGQAITYTVTTNSNPSLVATSVPTGNPFLRMQVDGFGAMVFELLEDKVPRPADRVVTLANQHFYDGLTFHRVINNFVIQGGDPLGTGAGGSTLPNFDDQFNVDLQHNRTGLLSFAKSTDDTNNSQFFITEGPQRHLDFNHSIFGVLVQGESVRDAISNVPVDSSNKPVNAVTMESVQVIPDVEDGVLLLKAPEGASGTASITVTARDSAGNTTTRTFTVTVTPDTINGGPFLNDIAAQRTVMNVPATINLTSTDVEGNAVTYSAVKADALSSTVTVNATTGVVTATPPTGFVGTMLVRAQVQAATGQPNDTQDKTDSQVFAVTVAPTAPASVDLDAASDSGTSSTDNITKLTTLSITVGGVTSGATVKLLEGTTVVGQATASGTSVAIPISGVTAGTHTYKATQTVNSIDSDASGGLTVTVDLSAPTFSTTAPTGGKVGTAYAYDAATNEEGNVGHAYSLVGQPAGMTIDSASGIIAWTPTAAQLGVNNFQVVATDAAGNSTTQSVSVTVADQDLVRFRIQITDTNGTALTTLTAGQQFLIRVLSRDLRASPQGVFSGYLDVVYDANLASVNGAITYGTQFPNVKSGTTSTAGLIDEGGATAGFTSGDGSELLLFSVPMVATGAGTLNVTGDPADTVPAHNVLLLGRNDPVPTNQIQYVSASATIGSAVNAVDDTFNVNEDSNQTTLSVLTNDTLAAGASGTLVVSAVGATNHGGTVSVASGGTGIVYKPAANFFGAETFTYTASNGSQNDTATVTVQVAPVNDPPTGTNDSLHVTRNSSNNILDVLANDSSAPDATEALHVTAVSNVVGGTAAVGPNGAYVTFTPTAGFIGSASLVYTLADPANATAQATATIDVSGTNNNPTATNDTATVAEDSSNNTVSVLANDSSAPDVGETLTVTAVGTPSQGGTVTIGTGGANVKYTPAANFNGTETFTYTISDGNGGSATATATMTVTSVNDNPTAANDTTSVAEDSSNNTVNVLANDSFAPDTGETLTVTAVGTPSQGGSVTIGTGGANVRYSPKTNFVGTETFTYTISDGHGGTSTATVTATVTNANDNPTAAGDTATVAEDSSGNVINVLANDSSAPDTGETLTVTAVGTPDQGGQVSFPTGGANVVYTPKANFFGTEKFTYTISDGHGGSATATVTVTVTNVNDPPTAVNDSFTVSTTATGQSLSVLQNDASTPDSGETLTITAVGATSNGGTVTIASDSKSVLYTPAASFLGTDTFTYTISDGNGGNATATVSVQVTQFVPSSLAGFVYLDMNRDGVRQASEPPITGVAVTLNGPSGSSTSQKTVQTDAQGHYEFTNLAPGSYTVGQVQPPHLLDGQESVGSQGGSINNNAIVVNLAENTTGVNNNFGELRQAAHLRFRDFLARTSRDYALVSLDANGGTQWTAGWSDLRLTTVTAPSSSNYQLTAVNSAHAIYQATVSQSSAQIDTLSSDANGRVLRFNGGSTSYNFQPTSSGSGEGEGEAAGQPISIPASTVNSSAPTPKPTTPPATNSVNSSATDSAISQLTQSTTSSSTPRSSLARFSAHRSTTPAATAVDQLMSQL